MKTAIIQLPKISTPLQDNNFSNMHGYWTPPNFVLKFWSSACEIEYIDDTDYGLKKQEISNSYIKCIKQFYSENSL
jgi:hypothetical protein